MNNKDKTPRANILSEDDEPPSIRKSEEDDPLLLAKDSPRSLLTATSRIPEKKTSPVSRHHKTTLKTKAFRKKFYPLIPDKEWNNWQWQLQNRILSHEKLSQFLTLSQEETLVNRISQLPLSITPYYLSLISPDDPYQPLRKSVVPNVNEWLQMPGESGDPLGEDHQSPVPGLVHRYPDRVLFLLSDFCSTYCRYCTRSRMVGHGTIHASRTQWEKALQYIEETPAVRDVLLSGGDPMTLGDDCLEWVLARLRQIGHVEVIRIGTKVPAVLPQRITPNLVKMLKKYHPLWMSLHFIHADECTPETAKACARLADAGIPLGSQTVLLKGINDSAKTMASLMHGLMKMRVRPYYLYQCDPITGSSHFRTSIEKGLEIIRSLRGFTSGYAVPTYVVDAPGGGGKIPLMPNYVQGHTADNLVMTNYENRTFLYPDPVSAPAEDILL
ncbi:KamA family radical SAM protein [uncultured Desulfobacter sp.]|uniref:KamA family radical SAM protein n=1 Tax=uncultured Desulfobacter sp. TaxID=240139 RepID=UPI002AABD13E|nr:KamA family radical SAM protein [uncultured Desulfobacter sp.]